VESSGETQARRRRLLVRARLAVVALVVVYLFLPYELRARIPLWAPFAAAVAVELHFLLGGRGPRDPSSRGAAGDRGPGERDLAELGGEHWREVLAVERGGERVLVPTAGLTEDELHERVEAYLDDPVAAAAAHDAPSPRPPTRRTRSRYLVEALAVLALVACVALLASRPQGWDAVSADDRTRAEAVFSREASRIAAHPARVSCDTSGREVGFVQDADGVAEVGGTQAYLVPELCDALYQLAFKDRVPSFPETARAIAVLAHEAWHLHGVSDEGLANCFAFQSGVGLGQRLGLSEDEARSMMRRQLATNAADSAGDPSYVVPDGCRDGGEHDLDPGSTAFP
jgi:hypothetical protein